ncbi:MAG: carbonic anhydrase [Robiginitomaculum sp.]
MLKKMEQLLKKQAWKQNLIEGYQNFRKGTFETHRVRYERLGKNGQNPDVLVIACSDSRASPSTVFNAYPGEIFVVRNVANIVPPYETTEGVHGTSAALEYGVSVLGVDAIIVMGHENCGGIAAYLEADNGTVDSAVDSAVDGGFIRQWINNLDDAIVRTFEDTDNVYRQMEFASVRMSLKNLMNYPFVRTAVEAGTLSLLGAYFSIINGRLLFADDDGEFIEVPDKE